MSVRSDQKAKLSDLGEFGLIDLIKKQTGKHSSVIRGIGDDAAVIPHSSSTYLLLTTDMLLEGVHFTRKVSAKNIGYKALACNVSDIAAMGGIPKYAVVSLGAPASCSCRYISQIYHGMQKIAEKFDVKIVGGDTVKSKGIIINIALAGEVKKGDVVYRGGARIGDQIFVTGALGRSLSTGWHMRFMPRVAEAQFLVRRNKPTAMIDISDGLAADLGHILHDSRVGAVIEESLLPKRRNARLQQVLGDGEDFELLFTVSPVRAEQLQKQKRYKYYRIGEIINKRKGFLLKTADGRLKEISRKGYTHF